MEFNEDMTLNGFVREVTYVMNKLVDRMDRVQPENIGLDSRSSYGSLYINDDWIVVTEANSRSLNYYGGFEYVQPEYVEKIGDYVAYSARDRRVREHIRRWQLRDKTVSEREDIIEHEFD